VKHGVASGTLGAFGILVGAMEKSDGGPAGLNELSQNTVQDNGGDGIVVLSSSNEVRDGTVKGNTGDGIMLLAGQTLNVIEDNKISDNGHDGIDNSAGSTTIAGNSPKNDGGADIAGAGDGAGTVTTEESVGNTVSDDSDLEGFTTQGELDLDTV
jgi:parallel beta-helix repeat protein